MKGLRGKYRICSLRTRSGLEITDARKFPLLHRIVAGGNITIEKNEEANSVYLTSKDSKSLKPHSQPV